MLFSSLCFFFFLQAEDGIRDRDVTGVQTCAFRSLLIRCGAHEQTRTADRLLTMQVLYLLSYVGPSDVFHRAKLERETGFEPATLSLEG